MPKSKANDQFPERSAGRFVASSGTTCVDQLAPFLASLVTNPIFQKFTDLIMKEIHILTILITNL